MNARILYHLFYFSENPYGHKRDNRAEQDTGRNIGEPMYTKINARKRHQKDTENTKNV